MMYNIVLYLDLPTDSLILYLLAEPQENPYCENIVSWYRLI